MRVYILSLLAVLLVQGAVRSQTADEEFAFCGDCWCIPADGETCPYDSIPETQWSVEMINNLAGMTLVNPLSLSCNPYSDDQCDTDPTLESGSVCAAEIIASGDTCPDDYLYR